MYEENFIVTDGWDALLSVLNPRKNTISEKYAQQLRDAMQIAMLILVKRKAQFSNALLHFPQTTVWNLMLNYEDLRHPPHFSDFSVLLPES